MLKDPPLYQGHLGSVLSTLLPCWPLISESGGDLSRCTEGQEGLLFNWSAGSQDSPELWLLGSHKCPAFLKGVCENQGAGELE